jgi:hypothetical protein
VAFIQLSIGLNFDESPLFEITKPPVLSERGNAIPPRGS